MIGLSGKPAKSLFEDQHPKRAAASDENIDPEIELESAEEQRVLNILLDDCIVVRVDAVQALGKVDAAALAGGLGLDDEGLGAEVV